MKYILFILLAICTGLTSNAQEESAPVSVTAGVDLNSAYVFHGMTYNSGPVLQPYLSVSKGRFIYTYWSNYNLQSDDNGLGHFDVSEFTESDHFLTYILPVNFVDLDATLGIYTYPALNWPSDKEFQIGIEKTIRSYFIPFARAGYMFDGSMKENLYVEFGAKGSKSLSERFSFDYNVKASWEEQPYYSGTPTGMKHALATGGFTYMASNNVGIVAKANYVGQLGEEVLPDVLYEVDFHASIGLFYTL